MRSRLLRHRLLLAAASFALLPAVSASAQTPPPLRRAAPLAAEAEPELTVKGPITPQPPAIKLKKPNRVTRVRMPPPPALRTIEDLPTRDPAVARPAVDTGEPDPAAIAPAPFPALEPEALPAAPRRRRPLEENPYAALGIEFGSYLLKPSIEVDFGYDTNPGRQPGRVKGSTFTTITPKIEFASGWSRNELKGSITGGFTRFLEVDDSRPSLDAVVDGRLDVRRDTTIDSQLRFKLDTERLGDDGVSPTAEKRPIVTTYGGTLGVTQGWGAASLRLRGTADRNEYEMQPGNTVSRDYTTYGLTLRTGYDVTPAIRPFVEAGVDKRIRDSSIDDAGLRRDSDGFTAVAGVALEMSGALTGEFSVGYGERRYEDPSLDRLRGVISNASLIWTPTALTTVTLTGRTSFDETSYAGSPGSIGHSIGAEIKHAFRRNLIGTASLTMTGSDYQGIKRSERLWDAAVGVEYRLSRSIAVKADYSYETLTSTVPGADYTANTIMLGLRLQR